MIHERDHFHLWQNKELDMLYVAVGLVTFASGLINIFEPIYFFESGFPLWQIFYYFFIRMFSFVVFAFALLPLMRKMTDKHMMLLGIPPMILHFLLLGYVVSASALFYIVASLCSLSLLLFNVGYHMNFSHVTDEKHIGREVGMKYVASAVAQFSAPLLGGILIAALGFRWVFAIASAILFISVIPLYFFPQNKPSSQICARDIISFIKNKSLRPYNISAIGYAAETMAGGIVWPLFIFLAVSGGTEDLGGIASLGAFAGAIVMYVVGMLSDQGKRRRMIAVGSVLFAGMWLLRLITGGTLAIAINNTVSHILYSAIIVSWWSQFYKLAHAVADPMLFIMSREVLYNVVRIFVLPLFMLLAYLLPQQTFFYTIFVLAAGFSLLFIFANHQHRKDIDGSFVAAVQKD